MADAYARWRSLPFPSPTSANAAIDEIRGDLHYWDTMVADTVIPVMERGVSYSPGALDLDGGLHALAGRIAAARTGAAGADLNDLQTYAAYVRLLEEANKEARLRGRTS